MLIFLDTEFTDFLNCELLSIAMVSEDGQYEFYAERTDYKESVCSDFAKQEVLPLMGKAAGAGCTLDELRVRLWDWFSKLPQHVRIATDSERDRDLLWNALGEGLPSNLDRDIFDLRSLIEAPAFKNAVFNYHNSPDQPWHHALHDARALRFGWVVWTEKSGPSDLI